MSKIIIRKAIPDDADEILSYLRRIGGESDNLTFGAEGLPFTVEEEAAYFKSHGESEKDVIFLAERDDEIIGDGSLSCLPRRMSHRAELGLSVVRDQWGTGVGSMLMEALVAHAQKVGIEMISLEVRSDNERAIRLYEKFGFQKLTTYPGYMKIHGKPVDVDLMYLPL